MRKIFWFPVIAFLMSAFSTITLAADSYPYATVGVGQGTAEEICGGVTAGWSCSNTTMTVGAGVGYQFSQYFAVELGYLQSDDVTASGQYWVNPRSYDAKVTMSVSGLNFSIVPTLPINEKFALIAKLGQFNSTVKSSTNIVGIGQTSSSFDNMTTSLGAGARFTLTDRVSIRLLYEDLGNLKASSTSAGGKVTLISGGLVIGF